MFSAKDHIKAAAVALELLPGKFRELPSSEGLEIPRTIEARFITRGNELNWWESFESSSSRRFPDGNGWTKIQGLVPDVHESV